MQNPFVQFLIDRNLVPENIANRLFNDRQCPREPIGMIAVSHGLLQPNEIDIVLDRQKECGKLFGDTAVELGFLTPKDVETLVKVQEFRVMEEITEALALAGVLSFEDATWNLAYYLIGDREVMEMMSNE